MVFIVFLILKLAEIGQVATWSWWWVTAPLWMPTGAVVSFYIIIGIIWVFKNISSSRKISVQKHLEELEKKSGFQQRLEQAQKKREEERNKTL